MPVTEYIVPTRHGPVAIADSGGPDMPILLLHGSSTGKDVFAEQLGSPLADMHRLIAIDLPGHGDSPDAVDPAATYTVSGYAEVVEDVLARLRLERAVVYGWSMGGHVAIELMTRNPAIAGIMISGTPPLSSGLLGMLRGFHASWDMLLASKEKFSERDIERFARMCFADEVEPTDLDAVRSTDGRVRSHFGKSLMRLDQRSAVLHAGVPVAMINGAADPLVKLSYLDTLDIPMLWEGRGHAIPGAAHAPFRQAPQQFNVHLHRFATDIAVRELSRHDSVEAEIARRA